MGLRADWLLFFTASWVALSGCSFIINRDADQCASNDDCVDFPGTSCLEGACTMAAVECTTTQQCVDKLGQYNICRRSDGQCAPLLSKQCTTVDGDYLDDNAFFFGSVLPITGDESTGVPEENAIHLAINDFKTTTNGLPASVGESGRRPLVLVACNDNTDADTAAVAAKHLVGTVGVPALIGAAYSGITIRMTTEVTIPGKALVISPSATATTITDLDDDNLVWRTSPSDVYQSVALASLIEQKLEPRIRLDLALMAGDKIKLVVLHKGDAYGKGLAEALEGDPGNVRINGASVSDASNAGNYERIDYGDPDDPQNNPPKYQAAIDATFEAKPHIVAIFGTLQGVENVMKPIEAGWDDNGDPVAHRPRYLFADGGYIQELRTFAGSNDALRQRVLGVVPGTTNPNFSAFRNAYNSKFPDSAGTADTFGAAGAYDASYLLAFAAVANAGNAETGPNLVEALKRMVGGKDVIDVGPSKINTGFQKLSAPGGKINFNGASGPVDFDLETGEAPSDVQVWCVTTDSGGKIIGSFSGIYLNAAQYVPGEAPTLSGPSWVGSQCKFD